MVFCSGIDFLLTHGCRFLSLLKMSSALQYLHLPRFKHYINSMIFLILRTFISALRSHRALALENLALRHQLDVLQRNTKKPRLKNRDRALWVIISRLWDDWRKPLALVQPETVVRWHKRGFQLYWRWKSRPKWPGRRKVPKEVRNLIRNMSQSNPLWGAPRIHGELLKLGIVVSQATVSKYMMRHQNLLPRTGEHSLRITPRISSPWIFSLSLQRHSEYSLYSLF